MTRVHINFSSPKLPQDARGRIYLSTVQPDMSGVLVHQTAEKRILLHASTLNSHVVVMVCICRLMKPKFIAGPSKPSVLSGSIATGPCKTVLNKIKKIFSEVI